MATANRSTVACMSTGSVIGYLPYRREVVLSRTPRRHRHGRPSSANTGHGVRNGPARRPAHPIPAAQYRDAAATSRPQGQRCRPQQWRRPSRMILPSGPCPTHRTSPPPRRALPILTATHLAPPPTTSRKLRPSVRQNVGPTRNHHPKPLRTARQICLIEMAEGQRVVSSPGSPSRSSQRGASAPPRIALPKGRHSDRGSSPRGDGREPAPSTGTSSAHSGAAVAVATLADS